MADDDQTTPPEADDTPNTDPDATADESSDPGSGDAPAGDPKASADPESAIDDTQSKLDATAAASEASPEPTEDEAAALAAVQAAISGLSDEAGSAAAAPPVASASPASATAPNDDARPFNPPEFDRVPSAAHAAAIDLLGDVNLNVTIELGRTRMLVEDVLRLNDGAVVELDKLAGDPVDVFVNGRPVARGEVLVLNDTFCVRINQILDAAAEIAGGKK